EKPIDEKPIDEKPIDEKPIDEKPIDEKPIDEKPIDEKPISDQDKFILAHEFWLNFGREGVFVSEEDILAYLKTLDNDQLTSDDLSIYVWAHFDSHGRTTRTTYYSPIDYIINDIDYIKTFYDHYFDSSITRQELINDLKNALSVLFDIDFINAHWDRSKEMYKNAPQTVAELYSGAYGNSADWQKDTEAHSGAHNLNGKTGNISYRYIGDDEQYKGYQFVFDEKDKLVDDPANMGSIDIGNSITEASNHFMYDMLPWILYGNSADDPTSCYDRIEALRQAAPGYVLEYINSDFLYLIINLISDEHNIFTPNILTKRGHLNKLIRQNPHEKLTKQGYKST
ncbi:MAG: hypothetical protein LBP22_16960, partial [Deltaproteobacteria bacterium]|nr:hypothetical protein [Deltaproteobacteria bacterium]